ncbi:class I SAM-dependent rRNA methyltransferase [Clostridiaceae bacterium 35-E11]
MKEIKLIIKNKLVKKYYQGYPLILKDAIINMKDLQEEGQLLRLVDEKQQFVAKGYYGRQNKGYGWILTHSEREEIDEAFFYQKLKRAIGKREKFFASEHTTAFRILNGEGDGVGGLTIDYFDGYYLINWYSKGMYAFKQNILKALNSIVNYKGIYEKKRFDDNGKVVDEDGFVCGERAPAPLIVKENDVNFAIYLNEGAMVGVFLDQREVRKALRDRYSSKKTVLNTFSYTGAFSIFAALGGAVKTTSVDLANRSLAKTIEHFSINKLDYEAHDIIVEDVFHYFKYASKKKLKFDVVILDPPSFATSKKHRFSAAKDYKDLIKAAIEITEKEGMILASTNCSTFSMKQFKEFIHKAFFESGKKYQILEEYTLPEDFAVKNSFPEGNYLKVVFLRVK